MQQKLEKTLEWLGRYKDGITVLCLIPAGTAALIASIWSMSTWNDQRERDLMKPIFEQHVKLTTSVYELVAKMSIEKNPDQLQSFSSQFWSIYYGPARQFLTPESMKSLQWTASYVSKCVDKHPDRNLADPISCDHLQLSTTGLARNARIDLSSRLVKSGLTEMTNIDAFVPREYQK